MDEDYKKAITYVDYEWKKGNFGLIGAVSNASWLGISVFDGARAWDGLAPDLIKHCERFITSCEYMGLDAKHTEDNTLPIYFKKKAIEGIKKFDPSIALYIRFLAWAENSGCYAKQGGTKFAVSVWPATLDFSSFSFCQTEYVKPCANMAMTGAKATCLYPNNIRALRAAQKQGYDNAIMIDSDGYVAEFSMQNVFMVKDEKVYTPCLNNVFLNGINRQRVIKLCQENNIVCEETKITIEDLKNADEVFSTSNYGKLRPASNFENTFYGDMPVFEKLKSLYLSWATTQKI